MKRAMTLTAGLLALFLGVKAHALNLQTIEQNFQWQTKQCVFTGVTSGTCDPAGFGSLGYSTSTPNGNITGFDYQVYVAAGSTNTTSAWTVQVTTQTPPVVYGKTYSPSTASGNTSDYPGGTPVSTVGFYTSGTITQPANLWPPFRQAFQARSKNPVLTFSGLSTQATTYVWVTFGVPAQ